MQEARPSRTAMMVARRRAAHQLFDKAPLVLHDPIAVPIIGPEHAEQLRRDPRAQRRMIAMAGRAMMVSRSRFAEEELARAVQRGVKQYVVLGAGLDTFAYRNPFPAGSLHVFEVDHPATQAWKRQKLTDAQILVPANVTFVAVDFEHDTLGNGLLAAGFDPREPAFFSWLGVTMYLTPEAITATLRFIASLPRGGGVALDYSLPSSELNWIERLIRRHFAKKVARMGEPFRTHFTPADMRDLFMRCGFHHISDIGAAEINARYFTGRADGLRIGGRSLRLISGEV